MKILLIFLILFISGCNDNPYSIDPRQLPVVNAGKVNGEHIIFSRDEAFAFLRNELSPFGSNPRLTLNDSAYIAVDHEDFLVFLEKFPSVVLNKFGAEYRKNQFDCEDFVDELLYWIKKSNYRSLKRLDAQIAVGQVSVHQKNGWATVKGGDGAHAIAGVITVDNLGVIRLILIEPQSSRFGFIWAELKDYPNNGFIWRIVG